jgi:transcriptional regulator with XRE-family HTH domain
MGELIGDALREDGISQVEFCRRVGVSEKHLSGVVRGEVTASAAQLDMWAFALDRRWSVDLVQREATPPVAGD